MSRSSAAGLRVAVVVGSAEGGVAGHVRDLAPGLAERGLDVLVAGPPRLLADAALAGVRRVPVVIGPRPSPVRDVRTTARLARVLRGVDVVAAQGLRAGVLGGAAARLARPRPAVVTTWHNDVTAGAVLAGGGRGSRLGRAVERAAVRLADATLTASDDLGDRVRAIGGQAAPLPVAAPRLPEEVTPDRVRGELDAVGRPLVVCVARLHPQKGVDVLVDGATALAARHPSVLVAVAGDGPQRAALQARVAATGAPVVLLGPRDDAASLLAAADVVVLPSRWDARALVAQEALLLGRPLVATAVGGLPGLLGPDGDAAPGAVGHAEREAAAVLVPPEDPGALAAAVGDLLADPLRAADLAARARARGRALPDREDMLDAVVATLAAAVGGRREGTA